MTRFAVILPPDRGEKRSLAKRYPERRARIVGTLYPFIIPCIVLKFKLHLLPLVRAVS